METAETINRNTEWASVPNDIMNTQTLEGKDHSSETCPLNFWKRVFRHAFFPESFAVHAKALAGRGSACSARALMRFAPNDRKVRQTTPDWWFSPAFTRSLRNRHHVQDVHPHVGVVPQLLHKPAVDNVPVWKSKKKSTTNRRLGDWRWRIPQNTPAWPHPLYAIDGEWRRRDISGHDAFSDPTRWRLKDFFLLICNTTHEWLLNRFNNILHQMLIYVVL